MFTVLSLLSMIISLNAFQFNQNGEFTILQLTDFHTGRIIEDDLKTWELWDKIIPTAQPDLVVLSGDAVSGYAGYNPDGTVIDGFYKRCWTNFSSYFEEKGLFYAYLLGNHDDGADYNRTQIIALDKTSPFSVLGKTETLMDSDTTNYWIPIYSSKDPSVIAAIVWMFDTYDTNCSGIPASWGCITPEEIEWYDKESQKIKDQYGTNIHHIAYLHIPIPEYMALYNSKDFYSFNGEPVNCPVVNTGFFDHVKKNGDISAIFVGHDHLNDFGGYYQGIELVYGRKSGYGGYGDLRGARVLKLNEVIGLDNVARVTRNHFIIEEDGSIEQNSPLRQIPAPIQSSCVLASTINHDNGFQFKNNDEFTIIQLTDFHSGESDEKDFKTWELWNKIIPTVQPDLVILSGDAVSGYAGYNPDGTVIDGFYKRCWTNFSSYFEEKGLFYAYLLGNHDDGADYNRTQIIALDKTSPFSVLGKTETLMDSDTTNYWIPIYSRSNPLAVAAIIWMFDTYDTNCSGIIESWGCITPEEIEWYDKESQKIKDQYGTNIHHIAYLHIPIPEYMALYNTEDFYSHFTEPICCPLMNTGFFSHVKKNGDISAIYVGHDHFNDFGGSYQGVELVYGRRSGYGGYGDRTGARVVKLKEIRNLDGTTSIKRSDYVIQEDGTIEEKLPSTPRSGPVQAGCVAAFHIESEEEKSTLRVFFEFVWKITNEKLKVYLSKVDSLLKAGL